MTKRPLRGSKGDMTRDYKSSGKAVKVNWIVALQVGATKGAKFRLGWWRDELRKFLRLD